MTIQKFSKSEAIHFGWNTMKSNFYFFVALLIVAGLFFSAVEIIYNFWGLFGKERPIFSILDLIGIFVGIIISLGLIKISLNFCDNIKSKISDLFSQYRLFFIALFATTFYLLVVVLGLILLVVPGIYFAIRFWFYDYFIVDKKAGVIESFKRSWRLTQGNVWNLFLLLSLLTGINILGALALLIGLFATIPTTLIAIAFVYRKLLAQIEITQQSETLTGKTDKELLDKAAGITQ